MTTIGATPASPTPRPGAVRIGISGWRYEGWRGVFYPEGLRQKDELAYAAARFTSIELNGSFYSLQRPAYWSAWRDATPAGFVFSVKGGRYVTHVRRLRDVETPLANFFASGVLTLDAKLGPFLWQFPPSFAYEPEAFASFLPLLPKDTEAAVSMALAGHSDWMRDRMAVAVEHHDRLRHAIEVRHASFRTPQFVHQLREHGIALVVADTAGRWPMMEDVTADFMYLRLHGDEELYASGYTDEALAHWAERICAWAAGDEPQDAKRVSAESTVRAGPRDVFVYFDNDVKAHAPFDAQNLANKLGVAPSPAGDAFVAPKPRRRTRRAAGA
jgi:uncharacterized protein YecE (DUF72 family)